MPVSLIKLMSSLSSYTFLNQTKNLVEYKDMLVRILQARQHCHDEVSTICKLCAPQILFLQKCIHLEESTIREYCDQWEEFWWSRESTRACKDFITNKHLITSIISLGSLSANVDEKLQDRKLVLERVLENISDSNIVAVNTVEAFQLSKLRMQVRCRHREDGERLVAKMAKERASNGTVTFTRRMEFPTKLGLGFWKHHRTVRIDSREVRVLLGHTNHKVCFCCLGTQVLFRELNVIQYDYGNEISKDKMFIVLSPRRKA
ncbi:hypothetical protein NC652_034312 [Populus alba x Populus x berolinensis]|nr:hypothetical protein NC652_034312 [Populus alba x Populus x berolinensis]